MNKKNNIQYVIETEEQAKKLSTVPLETLNHVYRLSIALSAQADLLKSYVVNSGFDSDSWTQNIKTLADIPEIKARFEKK